MQPETFICVPSPLGPLAVAATDTCLTRVAFCPAAWTQQLPEQATPLFLPLDPAGTDFQRRVWRQLIRVPYGRTCSYRDIARAVGNPRACRAVGGANHVNPIAIVIPCHRVIAADGSWGGYGAGIQRKIFLLELEKAHRDNIR